MKRHVYWCGGYQSRRHEWDESADPDTECWCTLPPPPSPIAQVLRVAAAARTASLSSPLPPCAATPRAGGRCRRSVVAAAAAVADDVWEQTPSSPEPSVYVRSPHLVAAAPADCEHGASLQPGGAVAFKVWAPHAAEVSLLIRVGCRKGGAWYQDYDMIGGQHRYAGTLAAAMARLEHVASLGFTAVQLMPISEHSDAWGYNPRLLMALHGAYGSPDDLRRFVDRAHQLGVGVIIDVDAIYGGCLEGDASNEPRPILDGKVWINLPPQATIVFQHML
ncbi:Malto-oligosyltrehalose trehalohydrolase [Tetrabaena socialis]|uniref:Malto-oligosyltrehalose trehalohydrolase n=1 Tax=Tetrabaena socialis TaxID=47790 RepID=A0A2J7ZRX6_9CHLO|nr:Malto-oligosyltrehalose trehalohydrolase [Tetrabaena socialis]|eukprot:PNH03027.1 Malto-oligosyltrehalose trehalohydrolase [Tetrabaena socialis]